MRKPTEYRFEEKIELALKAQGYQAKMYSEYDREHCQLRADLLGFIRDTQLEAYERLEKLLGDKTEAHLSKLVHGQILKRGLINVLRSGVQTRGESFALLYFQPKSGLNPLHQALYEQNRFTVVRQLHYSSRNNNSIDMVLFLNGLPIVTMELKNQFTGQSIVDSEAQYKRDRKPKGEPLLQFKRCLVHFCVDNDRVSMTTRLAGEDSRFFPYNKGIENPQPYNDYKTAYLWEEVLSPDSLLDILENFVLLAVDKKVEWSDELQKVVEKKEEALIFPRYHQWELIRQLKQSITTEGLGQNYLIQHTTGAGKSFSIGWLAHALTSLYRSKEDTRRMFDTVLVVTDRRVLDNQLQQTLKQLEQTEGVVHPVDLNAKQLKDYLEKGKDIIVTTVQKFPVISSSIKALSGRNFAVIIDEVHSSQTGETAKHLKKSLNADLIVDEEGYLDYEELINREITARGRQPNVSFFGFTGTPKNKTLELFGRKNAAGEFEPFHSYSMKQSIYEGFTLDVLEHYTSYKRYFKVVQTAAVDEELPEAKAMKQLFDYVDSHDEVIRQKVKIILHHFVNRTAKKIGQKARGMLVLRSRKHCVLFFLEMKRQMKAMGLPYSCLVAFSGTVHFAEADYTEKQLNRENGMEGSSIPAALKNPKFRILIVASKFQTGFDEPLMHSMYVDKKLSSVQAVQTLSRLNRTKKGKTDTFVLDFINDPEDIVHAFQPYYKQTKLVGATDPDKLYDIQYDISTYDVFTTEEVEAFCKELLREKATDERLQPIINRGLARWKALEGEVPQQEFKSKIQSFIRLYAYISQIIDFSEPEWEKLYLYLSYLNKKLPKRAKERINITEAIDLSSLRIKMMGESKLVLEDQLGELSPIYGGAEGPVQEEPMSLLSHIIKRINEVYGIELSKEDELDLRNVSDRLFSNEELLSVMNGNNSEDDKKTFFDNLLRDEVTEYYGDRLDFYKKVMNKKIFPMILDGLYRDYLKHLKD